MSKRATIARAIVFAPPWLVPGRIPRISRAPDRGIAPLCNILHHGEDCFGKARARQ